MGLAIACLLGAVGFGALRGSGVIGASCSALLITLALSSWARWRRGAESAHAWIRGVRLGSAAALLLLLAIFALIEGGETVLLRTFDTEGQAEETRLWIVDFDGSAWLGAGGGEARRWFQRLQRMPEVELVRGGVSSCFRAEPDFEPRMREAIVEQTRIKYRLGQLGLELGNRLGIPMRSDSTAIPVRLSPCDAQARPSRVGGDRA